MSSMDLKHMLNPADDDTGHRPHKRHSRSPSSGHPSSPDVYETSSQPASASVPMGNIYSYFDNQSSPSPTPSPRIGAKNLLRGSDDGNYTYHPELDPLDEVADKDADTGNHDIQGRANVGMGFREGVEKHHPNDSAHEEESTLRVNLDPPLSMDGYLHGEVVGHPDDSLPIDALPSDSTHNDDLDTDGPPLTAEALADPNMRLTDLSASQRRQYYAALWADQEVELQDFNLPKLHLQDPQFASEIWSAYIYHTTFSVNIWSNYDSWTRDFFWEPSNRLEDCGKVYLTPNQRRRLEGLGPRMLQCMKIRLDIGTPFRTLFRVMVWTVYDEDSAHYGLDARGWAIEDKHEPHDELREVVKHAIKNITDDGLEKGQIGLKLEDLDERAKDFVLKESKARPRVNRSNWWYA